MVPTGVVLALVQKVTWLGVGDGNKAVLKIGTVVVPNIFLVQNRRGTETILGTVPLRYC